MIFCIKLGYKRTEGDSKMTRSITEIKEGGMSNKWQQRAFNSIVVHGLVAVAYMAFHIFMLDKSDMGVWMTLVYSLVPPMLIGASSLSVIYFCHYMQGKEIAQKPEPKVVYENYSRKDFHEYEGGK